MPRSTALGLNSALALLAGCTAGLSGAEPTLGSVDTPLVCNEQVDTTVTVTGTGMTPLPVDVLINTMRMELPDLALEKTADLDGTPDSGNIVEISPASVSEIRWVDDTEMSFTVVEDMHVPEGVFDLSVHNPDGGQASLVDALGVVGAPALASVDRQLICLDDGPQTVELHGRSIVRTATGDPRATLAGEEQGIVDVSDCRELPVGEGLQVCGGVLVELQAGSPAGLWDLALTNPAPAACASVDSPQVLVVTAPRLDTLDPLLVTAGEPAVLEVRGEGLVVAGGVRPTVRLGDLVLAPDELGDCKDLEGPAGGATCGQLKLTLPDSLEPGLYEVRVESPESVGCGSEPLQLRVVAPPAVALAQPELFCDADAGLELVVTGSGFVATTSGGDPVVRVGGVEAATVTPNDCVDLSGPEPGSSCGRLAVGFGVGALGEGLFDVVVDNPVTGPSLSVDEVWVEGVAPPVASELDTSLVCLDVDRELSILGSGFVVTADGELPSVDLGGLPVGVLGASDCVPLSGPGGGETCSLLSVRLEAGDLGEGVHDVVVTNPEPVACAASAGLELQVVGPAVVTSLDTDAVCTEQGDVQITLEGSGFLSAVGDPVVYVGALELPVDSLEDCTTLVGPGGADSCRRLSFTLPGGSLAAGEYEVAVLNPGDADCPSVGGPRLVVEPPPQIDGLSPDVVCEAGAEIEITGSGFNEAAVVTVGGVEAEVLSAGSSLLVVTMPSGVTPGAYVVSVVNPTGCEADAATPLSLHMPPEIAASDPPTVYQSGQYDVSFWPEYSGVPIESGILSQAASGTAITLDLDTVGTSYTARLPSGLGEGTWDLVVTDAAGCVGTFESAVEVVADASIPLAEAWPPTATADGLARLSLSADPPAAGESALADGVRLYLQAGDGVATELQVVRFVDGQLVVVGIPEGLALGSYDLVAINPDGTVGVLEGELSVVEDAPPDVEEVVPAALSHDGEGEVAIAGGGFEDPSVSLDCVDRGDASRSTKSATVLSWSSQRIEADLPVRYWPDGAVCAVVVSNADGSGTRWASVSIAGDEVELDFLAGGSLSVARAAPAAVVARLPGEGRALYVAGGEGEDGDSLDSVEVALLDDRGGLGAWSELRGLPEAGSRPGLAVVGHGVFLVGGADEVGAATGATWQAQILSPSDAPRLAGAELTAADGGLFAGTWRYRVAALFGPSHPTNPDGESLASEPLVVRLPATGDTWQVDLAWAEVADAVGYRVYRSPSVDSATGTEAWLTDVVDPELSDAGGETSDALTPLDPGALGEWVEGVPLAGSVMGAPLAGIGTDLGGWLYAPVSEAAGESGAGGEEGDGSSGASLYAIEVVDGLMAGSWSAAADLVELGWPVGVIVLEPALHPSLDSPLLAVTSPGTVELLGVDGSDAESSSFYDLASAWGPLAASAHERFVVLDGEGGGGLSWSSLDAEVGPGLSGWRSSDDPALVGRTEAAITQTPGAVFVIGGREDGEVAATVLRSGL